MVKPSSWKTGGNIMGDKVLFFLSVFVFGTGIKPKDFHMLSTCSTVERCPQPLERLETHATV
jgi:hypothetical protein